VYNGNGSLKQAIADYLGTDPSTVYLMQRGKIVKSESGLDDSEIDYCTPIIVIPRVLGGKGGFGSMLRAIGAQIEKTTNRDACRDLSGRRLRDINEEQRLKRWFAKQAERDEEKEELRKQKLERMRKICEGPPLPKIDDKNYNQQRADMAESVFDAVDQGFEASIPGSNSNSKPSTSKAKAKASSTVTSASLGAIEEESEPSSSSSDSASATAKEGDSSNSNSNDADDAKSKPPELKRKEKDVRKIKKTLFDEDLDSDVSSSDESEEESVPPQKKKVKID
jgi:hypothetical protein